MESRLSVQIDRAALAEIRLPEVASTLCQRVARLRRIDQDQMRLFFGLEPGPARIASAVWITRAGKACPIALHDRGERCGGRTSAEQAAHIGTAEDIVELLGMKRHRLLEAVQIHVGATGAGQARERAGRTAK